MKTLAVIAMAAGTLALVSCVPPNARRHGMLRPLARLDCPARSGGLTRSAVAPDGRTCRYSADDGSEVELRLVKVAGGDPDAALAKLEAELKPAEQAQDAADAGVDTSAATTQSPSTAAAAAQAEADALADANANGAPSADEDERPARRDHVNIHLPGLHIEADDDKAKVRIGGLHVDADDRTDNVRVVGGTGPFGRRGRFTIDADDRGAVIRSTASGPNVRSTLIMASDQAGPQGWRAVGYQARGPRTGPLVVAVVHAKGDDHDRVFEDSRRLAARVAGG